ncbi:MAG: hypothetical protein AAF518_24315 [Spirochaetota bacterium]
MKYLLPILLLLFGFLLSFSVEENLLQELKQEEKTSTIQIRPSLQPSLFSSDSSFLTFAPDQILTYSEWKLWNPEQKKDLLDNNLYRFATLQHALPNNPFVPGSQIAEQQKLQQAKKMASIQEKLIQGEANPEELGYYYEIKIRRNLAMKDVMEYMLAQKPKRSLKQILEHRLESIEAHLKTYRQAKLHSKKAIEKF